MKKILVTGGPVYGKLDDVKLVTNRFKGRFMAALAAQLSGRGASVVYLCAASMDAHMPYEFESTSLRVVTHDGLSDYRTKVLELAPEMDGIILGAAVANLIPAQPFVGKFPSHPYKPGDIIPINFTIAPRVIDEVRRVMSPQAHLFGYKLLSGVSNDELIRAAYDIVLASGATAVFANDLNNLDQKYAVTKERGVHPLTHHELAGWILKALNDEYYQTRLTDEPPANESMLQQVRALIARYQDHFHSVERGYIFGTVAIRNGDGFVTTGRGKRELDTIVRVLRVDHETREVFVSGVGKASLNAPLLDHLFLNPKVHSIVHYHEQVAGLPTYPYSPAGTERDSYRPDTSSFNIKEHGCILLFDLEGRQL